MSKGRIMNTLANVLVVGIVIAISLSSARATLPAGLYGWTEPSDGTSDFVSIDKTTGQASFLFNLVIPPNYRARSLTYDPTNGRFYGILFHATDDNVPRLLAEIDPSALPTPTMTIYPFTGFPANENVEGIEYMKDVGLVISHATGVAHTNRLSVVNHLGVVDAQSTTQMPTIVDQDTLIANLLGGTLHAVDMNDPTNGYYISEWTDPFGSPSWSGAWNGGPVTENEREAAIDPLTNTFYLTEVTRLGYFAFDPDIKVIVGNFNYPREIWGIAAVAPIAVPGTTEWALIALASILALALTLRMANARALSRC